MKILGCILSLLISIAAPLHADDGRFVTRIIHDSDEAYSFRVPSNKIVKIVNFTQSGAVETSPGVFVVASVYVYQGAAGLPGIAVLTATLPSNTHQEHEDVFVAGPTTIYVPPLAGATLMFSYFIGNN